jgi:hypothetical protein
MDGRKGLPSGEWSGGAVWKGKTRQQASRAPEKNQPKTRTDPAGPLQSEAFSARSNERN